MFIALILLSVVLTAQTIYFIYYKNQIKDIGDQLSFILKHDSFKFIQTQIKPKEIYQLVDLCNVLLRKQRELNEEFNQKNEEINATIVSLSHDIRTPLTSLDGYLQLVRRSEDFQEKTQYVIMAQSRTKQIITLVDELFLYTKLQNPDYILELESIDVMHVLKRCMLSFIDEFSRNDDEPNIILPETSIYVVGNESAFERVFENIIRNYLLHGEGALTISYEENQDGIFIQFSNLLNEGHLISFNKIFNRFYKEDLSRTTDSSGLGLSIVKSLMEKMNGFVQADLKRDQFLISVGFTKTGKENGHV